MAAPSLPARIWRRLFGRGPARPAADYAAFAAVDAWLAARVAPPDAALDAALAANAAAGLPAIDVSPLAGRFLHVIARLARARRILEIGTLGGYSTICLARALPADGRLVTLEALPRHAEIARANLARAGLAARVEIRIGPALETLPDLAGEDPFDLIFIDADKENNAAYLDWALRLSRPGSLILVDNVVRAGRVADPAAQGPAMAGTRALFDRIAAEPRLTATVLQTVGAKGWDGFLMALVDAPG